MLKLLVDHWQRQHARTIIDGGLVHDIWLTLTTRSSRTRVNGTQTFRRPSTQNQSRDNLQQTVPSSSAGLYVPPHQQAIAPRNGLSTDTRYTKEHFLNFYQAQQHVGRLGLYLDENFQGPFDPRNSSGENGVEACWQNEPSNQPLNLQEMTEEDKQVRTF